MAQTPRELKVNKMHYDYAKSSAMLSNRRAQPPPAVHPSSSREWSPLLNGHLAPVLVLVGKASMSCFDTVEKIAVASSQ